MNKRLLSMTEEQKEKISKTLMGHLVSKETRKKISNSLKGRFLGENSPHWKYNKARCQKCNNVLANIYAKICGKCRSEKHFCIDCKKQVRTRVIRCQKCHLKMLHNLNRTGNNSKFNRKKSKCIDCGKLISNDAKRCKDCYWKFAVGKNNPHWKNKKDIFCLYCGKKIHASAKRCSKCYLKKENPLLNKKGEKSYVWKGGVTNLRGGIKGLEENKLWRIKVFQRDNYICQECFKKSSYFQAHHKKAFAIILQEFLQEYNQFSPIEDKETLVRLAINYKPFWDINNGVTLCKECHKIITKKERSIIKNRKINYEVSIL